MSELEAWLQAAAGSWWLFPALFALIVGDAFLVVLPGETAVVALGALAAGTGQPALLPLLATAALGAFVGDQLCYLLGRAAGTERWRWMRSRPVRAALDRARRLLQARAATVILTARYIPYARIAVNLTAGATRFDYRHFCGLSAFAALCWACVNVLLGASIGRLFQGAPLVGMLVSIVVAIGCGLLVDALLGALRRRRTL